MIRRLATATCLAAAASTLFSATANATPEQDQQLWELMYRGGIILNPSRAVTAAHEVCYEINEGVTPNEIAAVVMDGNATWSISQAKAFVGVAILIYCPPAVKNTWA